MRNKQFDIDYIRKYVNGELSPQEMFELERAAHDDEMLHDLILGVETAVNTASNFPEEAIQKRLSERISSRLDPDTPHLVPLTIEDELTPTPTRKLFPWKYYAIAASILCILGITFFIYRQQLTLTKKSDIALNSDRASEPNMTTSLEQHLDSLKRDSAQDSRLALVPETSDITASNAPDATQGRGEAIRTVKKKQPIKVHPRLVIAEAPTPSENDAMGIAKERTASPLQQNNAGTLEHRIVIRGNSRLTDEQRGAFVTGQITDYESNKPLAYAQVRDRLTNKTFQADSLGNFVAFSDSPKLDLDISSIGYKRQNLLAGTSTQRIKLHPEYNTLEEVVVAGAGKSKIQVDSEPQGGWKSFRAYIEKETQAANLGSGKVTLIFDINDAGIPSNIRVQKGDSHTLNQKALSILINGPIWIKGRKSNDIKLKIVFDN